MKSKIIIVIDHLGTGGAQQQVLEYLKCADRSRFEIKIINLDQGYNPLANEIRALGFDVIEIPHRGFLNLKTLKQLIQIFRNQKPDLVHTYLFTADCYGRLAAKLSGVKNIICSVRNLDTWMKPHHLWVDKTLARWTDAITINAEIIRPHLVKTENINPQKIQLIYNGIDLCRFEGLPNPAEVREELGLHPNALVVGMIGRFSEQKDFTTYFKAAREVLKKFPEAVFLAIGDGHLREMMEKEVQALGIAGQVIFTGLRKDAPNVIQAIDIGVLASHFEGCPNVILEFMAGQKPVVATNVGGCAELIMEGQTGFIVPENDAQALSQRILQLLESKEKRVRMGEAGRSRVEKHFTSQIMAQNTEKLYDRLLQPKVAFIFSQFPAYDETFILREMNQLKSTGLNFVIYSLKTPKDKIVHQEAKALAQETVYLPFMSLKFLGIKLYYFIKNPIRYCATMMNVIIRNLKSPQFFFKTMAILPKAIGLAWVARKNKITLVHGQWATYPATVAYVISQLNDIPFSFTGHAHDIYVDTTMLAFKIKKAKLISTCTDNNKKYLLSLLGDTAQQYGMAEKIQVTHHGIDLERFQRPLNDQGNRAVFTILSVGSLLECKGFNFLIDACKILKDRKIPFRCVIAGGGKLEATLREQISTLKLNDSVELTGYITQERLIPLYQQADLFVLSMVPEIHWGIPNVLVEAAACKIPVVCTHLPSIPELIIDGNTGFVIPPKDPVAIADAVEKIFRNKDLRSNVIGAAFEIVREKFDVTKNAARLKDVLVAKR